MLYSSTFYEFSDCTYTLLLLITLEKIAKPLKSSERYKVNSIFQIQIVCQLLHSIRNEQRAVSLALIIFRTQLY